jgi:O-antigen ligase
MIPGKISERFHGWASKKTVVQKFFLESLNHAVRIYRGIPWKVVWLRTLLAIAISLVGLALGGMTVILPPIAPIGVLAIPVLLLMWATPELRRVPLNTLSKAFYAVLFAEACIPYYYAVQIPGLPWLTVRRIFVLTLIVLFAVTIAGSKSARRRISETLSIHQPLAICIVGYVMMCVISIFTARYPEMALSSLAEFTFNWFVPAFACMIVVESMDDVRSLLKLIAYFFLIVTAIGVIDFIGERNYAIDIIPRPLLERMMEAYPIFAEIVNMHSVRNGYYRALSVFVEPLSFGECAAICAPIGGYFMLHGEKARERALGVLVIVAALTSLFVSGARGGSVAFLASMPIVFVLWVLRQARFNPASMAAPLGGAVAFLSTSLLIGLVFAWPRLHNMVLGGGDTESSDMTRFQQASLAIPKIIANPVTGYGIGNAAEVIGFYSPGGKLSVDTSILTLLVETGVPGLLLYFGMMGFGTFAMARLYVTNKDREASVGAALGCSFIAYAVYRIVLSQRENQWLLFILVSIVCIVLRLVAIKAKLAAPEAIEIDRSHHPTQPLRRPIAA